jgi:hypothetical protein
MKSASAESMSLNLIRNSHLTHFHHAALQYDNLQALLVYLLAGNPLEVWAPELTLMFSGKRCQLKSHTNPSAKFSWLR